MRTSRAPLLLTTLALTACAGHIAAPPGGSTGLDAGSDAGSAGPDAGSGVPDGGAGGPPTPLFPLEVVNDLPFERTELAFSAVPVPRALELKGVERLVVLDSAGAEVTAQLVPVARWGAIVGDPAAALRWVGVTLPVTAPASARTGFTLALATEAPPRASMLTRLASGRLHVSTGAAELELDPAAPGLLVSVRVAGAELLAAGGGPVVVDDGGNLLTASVDADGVAVEEEGPLRVVVRVRGHFSSAAPSGSACTSPLAYTARLAFVRGEATATLEWDLHNECGAGQVSGLSPEGADFYGQLYRVREVRWEVPLAAAAYSHAVHAGGTTRRSAPQPQSPSGVVQGHGSSRTVAGATLWRRARVVLDGAQVTEAEAFDDPSVAISTGAHTVSLTAAWVRFREPIAVTARGATLSFALVAEPVALGEAQVRWGFAQLGFAAGALDDAALDSHTRAALAALERGLLVTVPVSTFNAAGVKPRLPERATGANVERYRQRIEGLHAATLRGFERYKKYGLIWPDTLGNDAWAAPANEPAQSANGSNYWSASASELAEHYRTSEPRWVWDFALPLELTFLKANVYNLGTRAGPGDLKSGFYAGSGLVGSNQVTGSAFRAGWNSDDYLYNQGSDEAYLVRFSGSLRDVFAQACRSAVRRYGGSGPRMMWVDERTIARQTVQHYNMLRYAAEFVRDPQLAAQCRDLLLDIVDELQRDNLFGGIACSADTGNQASCTTETGFMYSSLSSELLWGVATQWRPGVMGTVRTMAQQYHDVMMAKQQGSTELDVGATWAQFLRCTFSGGALVSCIGQQGNEPAYLEERISHLSVMLIGEPALCATGARALTAALEADLWSGWTNPASGAGWYKGASQAMLNAVYGIGIAEACAP
ncbi:MAG: hypothetical protein JNK82_00515 [Myxococcaceae bacterium]|nr:hypothetical protein [Myxococcaceae bacterium]